MCDNPVQVLRPRSWNFRLRKGLPPLTVRSGGKGRGGLEELEENHEKQNMQEEKLEKEEYYIFPPSLVAIEDIILAAPEFVAALRSRSQNKEPGDK